MEACREARRPLRAWCCACRAAALPGGSRVRKAEGSGALATGVPKELPLGPASSGPGWAAGFGVQKMGSGVILLRTA